MTAQRSLEPDLNGYPQIEVVQIQFNYADFDDPAVQAGNAMRSAESMENR